MSSEAIAPAQPTPEDQVTPVTTAPAETPVAAEPEITDPLLIELREAEAAAQAEEAARAAPAEETQVAGTAPTATPTEPPPAPAPKPRGQPGMVPPARFNEVNARAAKAEQDAAYWRGVAEARGGLPLTAGNPGTATAAPAPTPEQRLTEIHTAIDVLAKKFDDGDITMADFKRQERELTNKEHAVREELTLAKVKPSDAPRASEELYLDTLTANIEEANPWVGVFDQVATKAEWDSMTHMAKGNLVDRGIDPTKGTLGSYELRKEMASLITKLAPALIAERATAKGITLPGQQPPAAPAATTPQARPALSPVAQARAAKLAQRADAPPNLGAISGTTQTVGVSDAAIEQMSEDEFLALPASTQKAILSRTSSASP
jgi:hypothetical protein